MLGMLGTSLDSLARVQDCLRIRNVLYKNPPQFHDPLPLVLRPDRRRLIIIHPTEQLSHPAKVTGSIDGKEQVDGTFGFVERSVEPLVPEIRTTPDFVFE